MKKELKALICTNLLAKGVNLPNVNLVINADLPVDVEYYADTSVYL